MFFTTQHVFRFSLALLLAALGCGTGSDLALSGRSSALGLDSSYRLCNVDSDCPANSGKCLKDVSFSRPVALFPDRAGRVSLAALFPTQLSAGQGVCSAECTQPNVTCEGSGTGPDWTCHVVASAGALYAATTSEQVDEYSMGDAFAAICRPPANGSFCKPCSAQAECDASRTCLNLLTGKPVEAGAGGVCTHSCVGDTDCALGFACQLTAGAKVCVPTARTCADCADNDLDHHGVGRCDPDQTASSIDCDDGDNDTYYEPKREPNPARCEPALDRNCNKVADVEELVGPKTKYGSSHCKACYDACDEGATCVSDPSSADERGMCSAACPANKRDCDRNPLNGCEVDVLQDLIHCGSCTNSCINYPEAPEGTTVATLPAQVIPQCLSGTCGAAGCAAGYKDCNGEPADGCESFIYGDPDNCGACGTRCSAQVDLHRVPACRMESRCSTLWCPAGTASCDGNVQNGCECSTQNCPPGTADCDGRSGCEVDTQAINGRCGAGECATGYFDCDRDPSNGCEASAAATGTCGSCENDCGRLAQHAIGQKCTAAGCDYERCDVDWGDCDGNRKNGCETYLRTTQNCGACGNTCPADPHGAMDCSLNDDGAVACVPNCEADWATCGGPTCSTSLHRWQTCGACDRTCARNTECATGTCSNTCLSTETARFADCNQDLGTANSNGCEIDVWSSDRNCGRCGYACSAAQQCVRGVCRQ